MARKPCELGHEMAEHFGIKNTHTHLNSGSYGITPLCVIEAAQNLQTKINEDANTFFRRDSQAMWKSTTENLAKYVGADPEDIALIQNATYG